jgi:hypothetical protein
MTSVNQLIAQTSNGIFFQAIAKDNASNPAKNRKLYVQSTIIQTSIAGAKVFIEEHKTNTDAAGMFTISIGNGTRLGGTAANLGTIDWANGPFYLNLKVAISPVAGDDGWDYSKEWLDIGTTSFGAVPFAFYAANVAGFDTKLNKADSVLGYVTPSKLAAKTFDTTSLSNRINARASSNDIFIINTSLGTKLNKSDSLTGYVTPTQLTSKTFDTTSLSNRINARASSNDIVIINTSLGTKLNKSDSLTGYVTPTQLISKTFDTTSLSNRINSNTASITANTNSISLKVNQSVIGVANGVASLDGTGKVPSNQLPPVTLNSTNVVGSEFDMLHLTGITIGSIAIRADINKNFVLSASDPTVLSNWVELLTPAAPVQSVNGYTGSVNLTKLDFGLNNVDNTTDALKPISNLTQAALNLKLDASKVGVANGTASLNASGKIPTDQIPAISFSSVKVLNSQSAMLALSTAVVGSVVIRTDVNKNYVLSAADPSVLANWVELLTPSAPVQTVNGYSGNVNIAKSDLGLSNVDNTSDANKTISNLTQTALNLKANASDVTTALALKATVASPSLTGTPLAPTATAGTNTTQIATTEYVTTAVSTVLRQVRQQVNASAGQVSFTLSQIPAGNSQVYMYINGIRTNNNAYSWSGNSLTYAAASNNNYALLLNDRIQFDYNY